MHNYYSELLKEAGFKDSKENYAAVDQAIKSILEMEGIGSDEAKREVSRWISDPTSAKRTMVVRLLREVEGKS